MPFGYDDEYEDFDACVKGNQDKDDPEGFCAWLQEETESATRRHPREDLIRMTRTQPPVFRQKQEGEDDDRLGTVTGHFAVFNSETIIDSWWEGLFREVIAPGAFRKTIRENRDAVRVLFNHGMDPSIGDKVLGPVDQLQEDEVGAYYEVPLLDTSYNRDLAPGLRAGQYGASFRFTVVKENWVDPGPDSNELPLRTIKEVKLLEFGPVTFPAYQAATAGLRTSTDFQIWRTLDDKGRQEFVRLLQQSRLGKGTPPGAATPTADEPDPVHSDAVIRAHLEQRARRIHRLLQGVTA